MEYKNQMEATDIFKCIADSQRLRILNLLEAGPLCVCHLQELLDVSQVKMSKQLAIMKQLDLICSHREGTWMVYSLQKPNKGLLTQNLKYLREADCTECNQLQLDLLKRGELISRITDDNEECPDSVCQTIGCC